MCFLLSSSKPSSMQKTLSRKHEIKVKDKLIEATKLERAEIQLPHVENWA